MRFLVISKEGTAAHDCGTCGICNCYPDPDSCHVSNITVRASPA